VGHGAFSIGVDLGAQSRIAAVEESGTQLEGVNALTEIKRGRERVVDEITDAVQFLTNKYSSSHKFLGLGIGIPGIIDLQSGTILRLQISLIGVDIRCATISKGDWVLRDPGK